MAGKKHPILTVLAILGVVVLVLGATMSIACQFGDLIESFLKRGFDAKDSSRMIPGHGGLLDRCDSLMLGAPIVLLYSILRDNPLFNS